MNEKKPYRDVTKKAITWKDLGVKNSDERFGVIGTVADRAREAGAKIVTEALMRPVEKVVEVIKSELDVPLEENVLKRFFSSLAVGFIFWLCLYVYGSIIVTEVMGRSSPKPIVLETIVSSPNSIAWFLSIALAAFGYVSTTARQRQTGLVFGSMVILGFIFTVIIPLIYNSQAESFDMFALTCLGGLAFLVTCLAEMDREGFALTTMMPLMPTVFASIFISGMAGLTIFLIIFTPALFANALPLLDLRNLGK